EDEEELERFAMQPLETAIEEESFTIEEFEESLAEANIVNLSSDNSLINKKIFNNLKTIAKSAPLPHVNLEGLKKWIKENYTVRNVTTEIEGLDSEQFDFVRRVLKIKLMQLRAGHGEKLDMLMDENTYTSTIVSPDFEILKFCFPYLFISRWNENDVPSSNWRHELVCTSSSLRKADGILFNYDHVNRELLLFENIGPPSRTLNPKYYAAIASKYYVLTYVVHEREGKLYRVNLAAPQIFAAERILRVSYPFEFAIFPNIIKVVELLLIVKGVIESNKDVIHNYTVSCMEETKNFPLVQDWICF
ncbi:9493_t:CDS:2, partial [Funneliformis geosporum]